jgi:hypothetical protein
MLTVGELNTMGLEDPNLKAHSYIKFYRRARFHRAWIVQEVTLAQKIRFVCGQTLMMWGDLLDFRRLIRLTTPDIPRSKMPQLLETYRL